MSAYALSIRLRLQSLLRSLRGLILELLDCLSTRGRPTLALLSLDL
jgi:hypothetical protein